MPGGLTLLRLFHPYLSLHQRFLKCGACPAGGAAGPLGLGGASFCVTDIFILNEIRTQDKLYILVVTLLG
jgi:hypothetical protein